MSTNLEAPSVTETVLPARVEPGFSDSDRVFAVRVFRISKLLSLPESELVASRIAVSFLPRVCPDAADREG